MGKASLRAAGAAWQAMTWVRSGGCAGRVDAGYRVASRVRAAAASGRRYHGDMSKLLLNLRHVPDDEADEVRAMLDAHGIAFYETRPSLWGVSAGGIWVTEEAAFADAERVMAEYQHQRSARVRADVAAARREGTAATFLTLLRAEPLRVVTIVVSILCLLGLLALPILLLRG